VGLQKQICLLICSYFSEKRKSLKISAEISFRAKTLTVFVLIYSLFSQIRRHFLSVLMVQRHIIFGLIVTEKINNAAIISIVGDESGGSNKTGKPPQSKSWRAINRRKIESTYSLSLRYLSRTRTAAETTRR
jgi:hypothetical protein